MSSASARGHRLDAISQKCSVILKENRDRNGARFRFHDSVMVPRQGAPTRWTGSICQYAVRMHARAFVVALSVAALGCDEPNGPSSPTTPGGSTTDRPPRVHGCDSPTNGPPGVSASVRQRRWRNAHPSELAQLRGNPAAASTSGPIRDFLHGCTRQHARLVPSERSERLRRESHWSCYEECSSERHPAGPEHNDSWQRRRTGICVHDCPERHDQSVVPSGHRAALASLRRDPQPEHSPTLTAKRGHAE